MVTTSLEMHKNIIYIEIFGYNCNFETIINQLDCFFLKVIESA